MAKAWTQPPMQIHLALLALASVNLRALHSDSSQFKKELLALYIHIKSNRLEEP